MFSVSGISDLIASYYEPCNTAFKDRDVNALTTYRHLENEFVRSGVV